MSIVSKFYPGVTALNDVSFELKRGEVRALCGENGAGKSTLIKCIMGVEHLDKGSITMNYDGEWVVNANAVEAQRPRRVRKLPERNHRAGSEHCPKTTFWAINPQRARL